MFELLPDHLFRVCVLNGLGPKDLASLAGVSKKCAAAVASTEVMRWANLAKLIPSEHFQTIGGHSLQPLCVKEACSHAARDGNLVVLELLYNTGCPLRGAVSMVAAAAGGHLDVMRWLRKRGCMFDLSWYAKSSDFAVKGGHLEVIKWLHESGGAFDTDSSRRAAFYGKLDILKFLYSHNLCWGFTSPVSTRRGSLYPTYPTSAPQFTLGQWKSVCRSAAEGGQLEVLKWWAPSVRSALYSAFQHTVRVYASGPRKEEILRWLQLY